MTYIKKQDALDALLKGTIVSSDLYGMGIIAGLDWAIKVIANIPTVDAEVVIRCEDCEYYKNDECHCPYILTSDGAHIYPYENDFCSYAEPKARDEE